MKNITLQLFEYLLAAQKSNLSIHYNLNKYPAYWFLDDILSFMHIKLEHLAGKGISIQFEKPVLTFSKIEVSVPLEAILDTLERDSIAKEQVPVSTEEFEKTLYLEVEAIMSKLRYQDQGIILVNDWQQILLGVSQSKISLETDLPNKEELEAKVVKLVFEYQAWQDAIKEKQIAHEQCLKEKTFYDEIAALYSDAEVNKKMNLGVGLLYIPGKSSVYHPLLTLAIEVFFDPEKEKYEFIFEKQTLAIDTIVEHVLFGDSEMIQKIQTEVDHLHLDPFDEKIIETTLKKLISYLHPEGNYFSSPVDALLAPEAIPQVLHRSVLFIKEEQSFNGEEKLRPTIEYLSKDHLTSDVISSVISPDFVANAKHQFSFFKNEFIEPMFIWQADSPERKILTYLQEHSAVAVFEEVGIDKRPVAANLITYLIATGKRVLIMGENEETLDEVQALLPPYLTGIHHKIPTKKANYEKLKEGLIHLRRRRENYSISQLEADKVWEEFEALRSQLDDVMNQMIDYRLLSSKNVNWQGESYHPAELAKMMNEFEEQSPIDMIPFDMTFGISDLEIEQFWELRPYFTPENMALLNYNFIDLNVLHDDPEYQKMLELEARYLELSETADAHLKTIFDDATDIKLVQYLSDQLPELMSDVAKIDTIYGNKVLRKSLENPHNHRELAKVLTDVNDAIVRIDSNEVPTDEKKACIQLLNDMLEVATSDLLLLDIQDSEQLVKFYTSRRAELMKAMDVAHLILIFNEGVKALASSHTSQSFGGITAAEIGKMDDYYNAATLHLSKVEFEIYWLRVKSHFIRIYQPIIHQPHVHPACLTLFEALQEDQIDKFKEILTQIVDLMARRHAFVTFGEFIDQISSVMPTFTASIMSEEVVNPEAIPNFKEAFAKGQLEQFFSQFQAYDPVLLEQETSRLKDQLLKLQTEMLEIECWRKLESIDLDLLNKMIESLEDEQPTSEEIDQNLALISQAIFMPLRENSANKNLDPNFFDLTLFIDASCSNIIRMTELVHSHKAVVFGNENEQPLIPLQLREEDNEKLKEKFGENLKKFGELYFETSLFDLVVNSAAWEAQVALSIPVNETIAAHISQAEGPINKQLHLTEVHQEIFETLTKMGYEVKYPIEIEHLHVDFLIIGQSNTLALNLLGITQSSKEKIEQQLRTEIELKQSNLNIHTIQSVQFHLDANKTMLDLYDRLERLNIYPSKNK